MGAVHGKNGIGQNVQINKASIEQHQPNKASHKNRRSSVSAEADEPTSNFVKKIVPKDSHVVEQIKAYVRTNFLFNSLQPEHLQEVVDAMEERKYLEGESIIKEGEDGDFFYVLARGTCEVFIEGKNDGQPIRCLTEGCVFGELALMYNAPRSATVTAKQGSGPVLCWALERATFRRTIMIGGQTRRKKYECFLNKLDLLKDFSLSEISHLADAVEPITFDEGSVIVREGDDDRSSFKFYIIESGKAQAFVSKDGKNVLMNTLHADDFFGEKALIEMTPRTATVKALTPLKCACLSIAAFERLMGPCTDRLSEKAHSGYLNVNDVESGLVGPKGDASP